MPTIFPTTAPKSNSGKNIPPGVPAPKLIIVNKNLTKSTAKRSFIGKLLVAKSIISSCPPPSIIGAKIPNIPVSKKGIITLTSTGTFLNFPYKLCTFKIPFENIAPPIPKITPNIINTQ